MVRSAMYRDPATEESRLVFYVFTSRFFTPYLLIFAPLRFAFYLREIRVIRGKNLLLFVFSFCVFRFAYFTLRFLPS
jgi:hypothetical protein